jgi:hypothetical protein
VVTTAPYLGRPGEKRPKGFKKFDKGFPLRENCDPENPYEAFLWMLVAWPGQNGGPLIMNIDYLQLVSKRLWDLGCRPVADPTLKYRMPSASEPNAFTAPGYWVRADAPDDPDERTPARRAVDSVPSAQQKAELRRELDKDLTPRERFLLMQEYAEDYRQEQEDGS